MVGIKKSLIVLLLLFLTSCTIDFGNNDNPKPVTHTCSEFIETGGEDVNCGDEYEAVVKCSECGKVKETITKIKEHEEITERVEPTCSKDGYIKTYCQNCGEVSYMGTLKKTGVHDYQYEIVKEATKYTLGTKKLWCKGCGDIIRTVPYAANGFSSHGALSVDGADLVDQDGNKFQLVGLSTHGIQWFGKYVNFETLDAIHNEFYNNVFRFSLYTAEGGYCEAGYAKREELYQKVIEGVKAATLCDCYAIIDWHMLGADDPNDKNPLYYFKEAKEFFARISLELKDYDNVLYEIMNEPCGSTTWADCKQYANAIIPIIRKNTNAIILVGNPKWTSDLASVKKSPLTGYDNIMYTYHFYANGSYSYQTVINFYESGFPVFISEHGGMKSDGDGAIDYTSIKKWYNALDERGISYVAWNISNSKGSASIIKQNDITMTDFSDEHLKEWGIYYKSHLRSKIIGLE